MGGVVPIARVAAVAVATPVIIRGKKESEETSGTALLSTALSLSLCLYTFTF